MSQPFFNGISLSDDEAKRLIARGEDLEFMPSNDHGMYCDCSECV